MKTRGQTANQNGEAITEEEYIYSKLYRIEDAYIPQLLQGFDYNFGTEYFMSGYVQSMTAHHVSQKTSM